MRVKKFRHTSDDLAYDSYLELKERQTEICERLDKITLDHQQMLKYSIELNNIFINSR
jgi:hypothetical protein